jgi:hypothetical protein
MVNIMEEIQEDKNRELLAEGLEEDFTQWIRDNKETLMQDFIDENYEDEFNEYCKKQYEQL